MKVLIRFTTDNNGRGRVILPSIFYYPNRQAILGFNYAFGKALAFGWWKWAIVLTLISKSK